MSGEDLVSTWLPVLGGLMLKSLIVFLVAGAALLALRRASASARHLVCLLTLVGLLALPPLSLALPGWRLAVLAAPQSGKEPTSQTLSNATGIQVAVPLGADGRGVSDKTVGATSGTPTPPVLTSLSSRSGRTPVSEANKEVGSPWLIALAALWLAGVLIAALRPLLGLWGIARLSQTSVSVADASTLAQAAECASALGLVCTPALLQADAPVPMTWGWRQPVVLLPVGAQDWPEGRLRAVLLHEMAHIRRRDWLSHRFADVVCVLYWFHPLVWLTARRLRTEGEIACDDLVLTSGVPAPDYARHLLDVARALHPILDVPQAAIAMARTARIEGRLTMILDATRPRRALTRRALLLVLGLSAIALVPLAVLRLGARAQAAPSGVASHPHQHDEIVYVPARTPIAAASRLWVQLVGIADPDARKWWRVDGTRLPQPIFDLASALNSGGPTATVPKQRRVQLAFRLPPSAQGVTVKYALIDSLNVSSGESWPSKIEDHDRQTEAQLNAQTGGARIVTATFPASVSKTNVRVGTASGPWNVIGITRRTGPGQIGGLSIQLVNAGYIVSRPAETKVGTVLTVSVNTVVGVSPEDLRIVAVDREGQKLLPADIHDSSIGTLDQITAHFALPPAQIKEIHVETRPFHYVEFKNVALRPAK